MEHGGGRAVGGGDVKCVWNESLRGAKDAEAELEKQAADVTARLTQRAS